jgi:peptidoglycan/xylan/chitin deacetylase (PgdA/CDA1 family)
LSDLVLKVDVDTFSGTREGVPRLLELFARENVRATFFFSLGPDNTGKAVKRVFRKGFVKKVLRASPAASYGLRNMLYGTLLPAPDVGRDPKAVAAMRAVAAAGHECGIHAWDHVDWHDRLPRMDEAEVRETVGKCHARFREIFGVPALVSAAPGWTATAASAAAQEAMGIEACSDTRGGRPFRPLVDGGRPARLVEIPSTLPTLDELLAADEFGASAAARDGTVAYLCQAVRKAPGLHVHSIHTEIEGGKALHALFARQLKAWKADGVAFVPLGDAARGLLASGAEIPAMPLVFGTLPGRATPVAMQGAAAPAPAGGAAMIDP